MFAAAVLCFLPALENGFVEWDDPLYIVNNPNFRGLGPAKLWWMFTNAMQCVYQPLAWITLGVDYKIWALEPGGYHLSSVLWHGALSVAVFFLFLRVLETAFKETRGAAAGALAGALLFAVHPLRAEAVAWASERRELVGGFFWVLAAILYLSPGRKRDGCGAPLAAYFLALLAKGTMLTLPLVLLVLDWYPLGRIKSLRDARQAVLEKWPYFLLALVFGLGGTYAIVTQGEPGISLDHYGLSARLGQMAYSFAFYPAKSIWPTGLTYLYQMPQKLSLLEPRYLASLGFVGAVTAGAWALRRRAPAILAAWGWYAACLLPVVGMVKYGPHIVADRYANLSTLGLYALAGAGVALVVRRLPKLATAVVFAAVFVAAGVLGRAAAIQTTYWRDSVALWTRALESAPDNARAHGNLAVSAMAMGRFDLAISHCRRAIQLEPDLLGAYDNLAAILSRQGRWDEAADVLREEIAREPRKAKAHWQLALMLVRAGKVVDAEKEYQEALRLDPKSPEAHFNYGALLTRLGRLKEAYAKYQEALSIDPGYGEAHNNLGLLLAARGQREKAFEHFRFALGAERTRPLAHLNWGNALSDEGKLNGAARHYREAIRLDPSLLAARFNLANTLVRQRKIGEARRQYQQLLEKAPWYEPARRNLHQLDRLIGLREDDR